MELPRLCFVDPQRVCISCVTVSNEENQLYNKYLPILSQGMSIYDLYLLIAKYVWFHELP